ncbi:MAG: hypothetical protein COX17_05620 [Deltaproteobacteria bacterium CG23_combo_of_CG06-09_8_20_14_all_60_8]|nr:MAG: hypothetical protein COX17_05620 [Deltaproteobacteria bacterium CG23_combo_of_CG06-09_8_20_14_all_60_8]
MAREQVERFSAWISKHALTHGVFRVEVEQHLSSPEVVCGRDRKSLGSYFFGEGVEWHRTPKEAIKRAEAMREAKLSKLERQIEHLKAKVEAIEGLKFD